MPSSTALDREGEREGGGVKTEPCRGHAQEMIKQQWVEGLSCPTAVQPP